MKKTGLVFVISGPSGSGKTTLAKKLLEDSFLKRNLCRPASFTTRPRRPGERNGHDYYFVTRGEFLKRRGEKKFLEWTQYLGYYYATAKDNIRQKLDQGKSVVLCVDQRGAFRIKTIFPKYARLIFILPPDLKTLEKRIHRRSLKAKNHEEIVHRLRLAQEEMKLCKRFDYCVMNKNLARALNELKRFVRKEIAANQ